MREEAEWKLLYSCIVAGKSATFADGVMGRLKHALEIITGTWFEKLSTLSLEQTETVLRGARSGNYGKLARCFYELSHSPIDILTCAPADLEAVHGIGPKTSRFFILWTRPGERCAALDVHVLRWLRHQGYDAPKSTPNGLKYAELERAFIAEAEKRNMTARELDFQIWEAGSGYTEGAPRP